MDKTVLFLDMFPDFQPPDELRSALSQAAIAAADIDPVAQKVQVALHSNCYIPLRHLKEISRQLQLSYGLRSLELTATHPADQLQKMEPEELRDLFVEQNSMNRGALAGAQWQWTDQKLTVKLLGNGVNQLQEAAPAVQRQLQQRFATPVTIEFEAGQALEGKDLFAAMEKMRDEALTTVSVAVPTPEKKPQSQPESVTFYGKPFKGTAIPMKDLNLDMGSVIVEGKVFAVEHKELKKRNAWVVNFDMTDNTGSIRINRFMEANEAKPILENVNVGSVLRVQGKLMINQFDNETVLKPFSMMPGSMPKRQDTAVGNKLSLIHI